jgi:hypothetical protein
MLALEAGSFDITTAFAGALGTREVRGGEGGDGLG